MREKIWGLDLGTTSIGFAVVEHNAQKKEGEIIRMGVRIFPEGITEKEMEPRNKKRREKRLLRKQLRRRKRRRIDLCKKMEEFGLLPKFESSQWKLLMNMNPYLLRSEGMERELIPFEFGRALYHLTQHRGFKSSRKTVIDESKEDDDTGKVKSSIEELKKEMKDVTLGQHLNLMTDKKRGRYLGREMVEDEFEKLWEAQAEYKPEKLTQSLKNEIKEISFFQLPVFWRTETLGECNLEPESPLCLKGSWVAQRFLLLQDLNILRIFGTSTNLVDSQREMILENLSHQGSMTWGGIRRLLKPFWIEAEINTKSKFNLEEGKKKDIQGNLIEAKLKAIFKEAWENHPKRQQITDDIPKKLWDIEYGRIGNKKVIIKSNGDSAKDRKNFIEEAQKLYSISKTEAVKLSEIGLPPGWLRHSEKAIRKLLPYMEKGLMYSEACDFAYPDHRDDSGEDLDKLPSDQRSLKHIPNPTVKRALNELRKVVNNLISLYGKPDKIRIELLRELKQPPDKRREYQNRTKKQENERKEAEKDLIRRGINNPDNKDKEKWLLWKECEQHCIYTGSPIGFQDLFFEGRFEVEHIIPLSVGVPDNTYMNKTLSEREFNQAKGNRLAFEAYPYNEVSWDDFLDRVKKSKLPPFKKSKLSAKRVEDALGEDFGERQLRDSSYIAKEASKYLMKICKKEEGKASPIEVTNGMITSQLRGFWGFTKKRSDHRHHAIDALVTALVSRGNVQNLSILYRHKMHGRRWDFPKPWNSFHQDAMDKLSEVIVSHKVQAKISGELHREMPFRKIGEQRIKRGVVYELFSKRLDLIKLSPAQKKNLLEDKLEVNWDFGERNKRVVIDHLRKNKDFKKYPSFELPDGTKREIKHVSIIESNQSKIMTSIGPSAKAYVEKFQNHHMVVYETPEEKIDFDVVSLFDAAMRLSKHQPVIQRNSERGMFLMSLCRGDTLFIPADKDKNTKDRYVVVVSPWANGQLSINSIYSSHKDKDTIENPTIGSLIKSGIEKVSVDPIGRINPKND